METPSAPDQSPASSSHEPSDMNSSDPAPESPSSCQNADAEQPIEKTTRDVEEGSQFSAPKAESTTSATGSDSSGGPDRSERIPRKSNSEAGSEQAKRSVSFSHLLNPESRAARKSARNVAKDQNLIGGKYTKREFVFVTTAGVFLSFNSGYVNGSCLSGLLTPSGMTQAVSSFTGTYTNSALDLAQGDVDVFGRQVGMILSFILGSCISGYMTPNAVPYRLEPTYGPTFIVGGVFLTIASILAVFDQDHYLFYFAAAANGIQNGISSIYSANLIRSTHLTGTSTDIGIFMGQILSGNKKNLWKLLVLIALAVSFWLGSLISFYATLNFTHFSLLFNAGLFVLIGAAFVIFVVVELDVSVQSVIMGTWLWGKVFDELYLRSEESFSKYFDKLEGTQDDGELDEEELFDALAKAGIKVSRRQVEVLLRAADTDGNGKIDKDEWMKIATSSRSDTRTSTRSTHSSRQSQDLSVRSSRELSLDCINE